MNDDSTHPEPIAVGRIDFVNTAPVYHGIDSGQVTCPGRTVAAPPAELNRLLTRGKIDISAVSSAAYAHTFPRWLLLPDLSITARGAIGSVVLARREKQPLVGRPRIGLTDKSATAQALTRLLLEDARGLQPDYRQVNLDAGIPTDLDAMLVIGDDALRLPYRETYPHITDLGAAWRAWTGLPMVFGVWAVTRTFAEHHPEATAAVTRALQASRDAGLADLDGAAGRAAHRSGLPAPLCRDYLAPIDYALGPEHVRALEQFFTRLATRGECTPDVRPAFFPLGHPATTP